MLPDVWMCLGAQSETCFLPNTGEVASILMKAVVCSRCKSPIVLG